MGYFSNGSEGCDYQSRYCSKCVNWRDKQDGRGEGCPVYDLHLIWNYGAHGDPTRRFALDHFIPSDQDGGNAECAMFLPRSAQPPALT